MTDLTKQNKIPKASISNPNDDFDLQEFFPYLVRAYHLAVSGSLSLVYSKRLGIVVTEWRAMAALGSERSLSASEIVQRTDMDKVVVSRAIKGLQKAGFLRRDIDGQDKRRVVLSLTKEGREAFELVLPLVQKREQELLKGFSTQEQQTLLAMMERVRSNAKDLE